MDEKIISADRAFEIAIQEAERGAAFVSPNPLVGCVIVSEDGRVLATGYHHRYGEAHAEVDALQKLKPEQLKNASVYVTLEPCAHQGKTPACAKALALLPIRKVVYGLQDPNPLVSGKGAALLAAAGIEAVEYQGRLKPSLEILCEVFLKNQREKKIFVAAKVASSLDGQIAMRSGESRWITGTESREKVHELRARYDAILVGRKTIEMDDPSLDVRHPEIKKEMKLVILDPRAKIISSIEQGKKYKFLEAHQKENIFFGVEKISNAPFKQVQFSNLESLHASLWELGVRSIFVEGGARTYSRYLHENLIDRLHLFLAPSIIGSENGLGWTGEFAISELGQKKQLQDTQVQTYGNDIYITGKIKK